MTSSVCSHRAKSFKKVPGPLWVDMEDGLVIARAPRRWRARAASRTTHESGDGFVVLSPEGSFYDSPMAGTRIHCYPTHRIMRGSR